MRYGQVGILLGCIITHVEGLRFLTEPENKTVVLSQPLWWYCHAEDAGPVTYSWKKDGSNIPFRPGQSVTINGTLHITNIENADVGNYTCVVEASGQVLHSKVATLRLAYINPTFSVSPLTQIAFLGDPVLLQCYIDSLPPAVITFTLNGEKITKDTITIEMGGESTYRIYPVMYPDAGVYKCEGRNPMLNIVRYSDVGELTVQGPPVFTSSLQSVSIPLGLTATFDCRFDGNPEPRVAWFVHRQHIDGNVTSKEITNSRKYAVYPNGTMEIYDVTQDDVAFYTCRVANSFGEMSDSASLNTTGQPTVPVFTTRPVDQTIRLGGTATFTCQAESNPEPTVVWMFKGVELPSTDGHLTITNAQLSDAGMYVCVVENGVGYKNIDATLNILVAPSIVTKTSDMTVVQGSRAILQCQATGNPTPGITWTTPNSVNLTSSSLAAEGLTVSADGSLLIGYVLRRHHGKYTCTATNEIGTVSATTKLIVEVPPVFTKSPVSHGVQVGERAMFHCQASGHPTPSMYWSKDGEGMISSTAQRQIYLNNTLVIHSVKTGDRGVYRCHAYNSRGSIEAPVTLNVIVPPTFSVRPTSQKVRIGDDVSLNCVAIGDPVPTQRWEIDGRQLVLENNMGILPNFTLVITSIRAHQFGDYDCVATNMAASITTYARIQTEDFPILTIRPSSITVNTSATARLQCRGEALEPPVTSWFRLTGEGALAVSSHDRVTVTAHGELIIQDVQSSDEGWYQCVAANSVGNVSENAFINVLVPPKITHTNSPQTTVMHSGVTLSCQSTGDPAPTLIWLNPIGEEVISSSSYIMIDNTLQIASTNKETDGGHWTCRACNFLGCDEAKVELKVEGPPAINSITGTQSETGVILSSLTSGEPKPTVTFTHQGGDVTLNFKGHRMIGDALHVERDYVLTSYVCKAENRHGKVKEKVSIPSDIALPTIISSTSKEINVSWSTPDNLGGLPLTGYQIEATSDLGKTWLTQNFLSTSTNGTIEGLSPYTNYQVRVAGVNILGVGIYSEWSGTVMTDTDAPSPPTNVTVTVGIATILLIWNHSIYLNGPKDDIEYRYTISIPTPSASNQDNTVTNQTDTKNITVYQSGSVSANQELEVIVEGLHNSAVYTVTVWAVNIVGNKSSEPVIVFADLTVTVTEQATVSPDTVIIVVFGVVGGIILILVIIFAVTQIRQMKKTRSMSLVNSSGLSDQYYVESPKNLYGKKSKFSMRRSSSQGFYKFDNDESFHTGTGSVTKLNGSALKEKHEDKDVLLTAKNPLYDADPQNISAISTSAEPNGNISNTFEPPRGKTNNAVSKQVPHKPSCTITEAGDTIQQSCEQGEIEIPASEYTDNFTLKSAERVKVPSPTGSDVMNTDSHMTRNDSKTEINSISKESDGTHIYEVPNLESRSNPSGANSPVPTSRSNISKSKPIRVTSLENLADSPPHFSHNGLYENGTMSPLDSPTDERNGDPEREIFRVKDIRETSFGEDADLLPHKKSQKGAKREISPPKDIKVRYDMSDEDLQRDHWSAALY